MSEFMFGLGSQERLFLTSMAGEGNRIFRVEAARSYWSSDRQTRKALSRLERKGWLKRLERGLYLIVPLEAGPEGHWSEDPLVIATQLVQEGAVAYWSAFHYWQLTEQVPRTFFVQTLRQRNPAQTEIQGVTYRFVWITEKKYFGVRTQTSEGIQFSITDREKTLVDACDRPDLCGGIVQVAQGLQSGEPVDWDQLERYLERMGSGAVYKRLGYLIEHLDFPIPEKEARLASWQAQLTQGIALLDLGGARSGPVRTKWRVRVNAPALE
jgi:predicted transcriptional regulator of viral defense system